MLSEKMDVLQLAFYTAPVSSAVLLPFFWFLEVRPTLLSFKACPYASEALSQPCTALYVLSQGSCWEDKDFKAACWEDKDEQTELLMQEKGMERQPK